MVGMGNPGGAGREPRMQAEQRATAPHDLRRSLLTMLVAFFVLWFTVYMLQGAFVAAAFGGGFGVFMALGVLVAAVAAIAAITQRITGQRTVGGAVVSVGAAVAGLILALASFREIPFVWVPAIQVDVALPAIAVSAVLTLALFLRPVPVRVVGAVATVAMVVVAAQVLQPDPPDPDLNRVRTPEELFQEFGRGKGSTKVPDATGYRVVTVSGFDNVRSTVLTPAGHAVEVRVDTGPGYNDEGEPDSDPHGRACRALRGMLQSDGSTEYDETDCVIRGAGWARSDGSGMAWMWNGALLVVTAADPWSTEYVGGAGEATPAEVAEAARTLRPITEAELRQAFEKTLVEGER